MNYPQHSFVVNFETCLWSWKLTTYPKLYGVAFRFEIAARIRKNRLFLWGSRNDWLIRNYIFFLVSLHLSFGVQRCRSRKKIHKHKKGGSRKKKRRSNYELLKATPISWNMGRRNLDIFAEFMSFRNVLNLFFWLYKSTKLKETYADLSL